MTARPSHLLVGGVYGDRWRRESLPAAALDARGGFMVTARVGVRFVDASEVGAGGVAGLRQPRGRRVGVSVPAESWLEVDGGGAGPLRIRRGRL